MLKSFRSKKWGKKWGKIKMEGNKKKIPKLL
jgi:hypothetical protein